MSEILLYNTSYEQGVRVLLLMNELESPFDLDSLVFLDYILVHSGDMPNGPKSIHANIPFRHGELIIKRELIFQSIKLFQEKGLIDIEYSEHGIRYKSNLTAGQFLSHFESKYYKKLVKICSWVKGNVPYINPEELASFTQNNVGRWTHGFENVEV